MARLDRLLSLALRFSARRRFRAEDAAEEFGVGVRTVYRDIRALEAAGFPLRGTPGDGYVLEADAHLRPLALSPIEAEAAALALRLFRTQADGPLAEAASRVEAKLEAVLPREAVRRLARNREVVRFPMDARSGPLSVLLEAVHDLQVVRLTYDGKARGERTEREVEPLGLVRLGDSWVVPAWCRLRGDIRSFRSDLIRAAVPTGEHFTPRPGATMADLVRRQARETQPATPGTPD